MGHRVILTVMAFVIGSNVYATDNSLKLCSAGGYYAGAQDHFLSGLATHILLNRGVLSSLECTALWKNAVEIGERYSTTGKPTASDMDVIKQAVDFSERVYRSLSKASGYSE